jgi:TonB family protein
MTTHPPILSDESPRLEDAFTTDASDHLHESHWADAALPDDLLAVTPTPPPVDVEELEDVAAHHRVLILRRGAVIAVSTLLSIGGALLLHSILGGAFLAALFFGPGISPLDTGSGSGGDAASEGGKGRGYMMLADAGDAQGATKAGTPTATPDAIASLLRADPTPQQPVLPPALATPPSPLAQPGIAPVDVHTLMPTPPTAAPEVPPDFGTVTIKPPVRTPQPAPAEELRILPPDLQPKPAPPVAADSPTPATPAPAPNPNVRAVASGFPAAGATGPRGNFGEADDGDEELPSMLNSKAGGPGKGNGRGRGMGGGLDRGPSGADRPEPIVLDNPMPSAAEQPSWIRANPPKNAVVFHVRILETGAIGDIELVASSGRAEVDAYYRDVIARWKYGPAIKGGRPFAAVIPLSFDPRAL